MKRLLIAIICFSLAATAYTAYVIAQRQAALHEVSRDLDSWSVSQTLSEYMRLEHELAEYQLGMPGVNAGELRLRVDILLGRLDQLKEGSLGRFMQEKPARAQLLAGLHDVLWAVDKQLDAPPPVDFHLELEKMGALDAPMTTLAASVIAAKTAQIDAQEEDLQKLHLLYTALAGSLMLCGIALILMLLRQNGLLRGTQSDMNQLVDDLRVQPWLNSSTAPAGTGSAAGGELQADGRADRAGRGVRCERGVPRLLGVRRRRPGRAAPSSRRRAIARSGVGSAGLPGGRAVEQAAR